MPSRSPALFAEGRLRHACSTRSMTMTCLLLAIAARDASS